MTPSVARVVLIRNRSSIPPLHDSLRLLGKGATDGGSMRITRPLIWSAPLLALLLIGCGSKSQVMGPGSTDASAQRTAVADELGRHPEMVDDGVYETQTQAQTSATAGTAAAIDPLFFWRQILRVDRTFEFAFSDTDSTGQPTTAVVTVDKRLSGWFNILARDSMSAGDPGGGSVVRKELRDHWVRRVLLKRVAPIDDGELRPWRVAAVSGVQVTSRDAQTRLQSLRLQSGALDTTITDPLAFWR